MKVVFTQNACLQVGTADGVVSHDHRAGETVEVAADLAAIFISQGVAEPAKAEKAVKPRGESTPKD